MYFWIIVIIIIVVYFYKKGSRPTTTSTELHSLLTTTPEKTEPAKLKIDELILKNNRDVLQNSNNPQKIKELRDNLEKELNLSTRLYHFYDEIKYYPSWYRNSKNDDGTPYWKSNAIKPDELLRIKFKDSKLKLTEDKDEFKNDVEVVQYVFQVDGKKFFCEIPTSYKTSGGYVSDDDVRYYHLFYLIDDENRIVLKDELYFKIEEYGDTYLDGDLEIFKPGNWTAVLYSIMSEIKREAEIHSAEFDEKMRKEREEKIKKNFL